jgi:hypothetical protein
MSGGRKAKCGVALAALVVVAILLVTNWAHWRQPYAATAPSSAFVSHIAERRTDLPPRAASAPVPPRAPTGEPAGSVAAVDQDETSKECSAIAELLVGPGTTLLSFGLGGRLGERVGWPTERVHQIAAEREALLRILSDNEQNLWSCDTLSRVNEFIDKRLRQGEITALRELKDQRERPGQPVSN